MTRCIDFYKKCEEEGPDWCEKCPEAIRLIENYLDLCNELEKQGIPKETTMVGLSERASRPLFGIRDEIIRGKTIQKIIWRLKGDRGAGRGNTKILTSFNVHEIIKDVKKELKPTPELPTDKYRVIYADPPWRYNDTMQGLVAYGYGIGAEVHYGTMSIEELCDLPIPKITEDDAVLFLWVTAPILEDSFKVVNAWGFEYKTCFVWDKIKHNMGHYSSVRHELLLLCSKGECMPDVKKLHDSVISIEKTKKHSEKPEEFRKLIDSLYTSGRKIELFARKKIEGWSAWGNEL